MQTKKPTVVCCTALLAANLLRLEQVELRDLADIRGPRWIIAADDGTFWVWPLISEEVDSNSPCQ